MTHSKLKKCVCGIACSCLSRPKIPISCTSSQDLAAQGCWPILTGEDKVQIVYRKQIKVHYAHVQAATQDGYTEYDKK